MERDHTVTEREFSVPATSTVVSARLSSYLEGVGYHRVSIDPLTFERGTHRGSRWAFTPTKWHSVVTIVIQSTDASSAVKAVVDVDTTGQLVTAREALFWQNEVDDLESTAKGQAIVGGGEGRAKRAYTENLQLVALLLVCVCVTAALVFGVFTLFPPSRYTIARIVAPIGGVWFCILLFFRLLKWLNDRVLAQDGTVPSPPVNPS